MTAPQKGIVWLRILDHLGRSMQHAWPVTGLTIDNFPAQLPLPAAPRARHAPELSVLSAICHLPSATCKLSPKLPSIRVRFRPRSLAAS